ncbi:hypothetical protein BpHYR1_004172 [Brachionus plicatilis]|uniref:Uncharacterized protein n=1 Tax=Brachionus plicatilis TaxID=10195 RepID=A0A3M7R950_BRAPC|nr:hypothetical protein BpHYR1_004172 [Brachionus plicatilis]
MDVYLEYLRRNYAKLQQFFGLAKIKIQTFLKTCAPIQIWSHGKPNGSDCLHFQPLDPKNSSFYILVLLKEKLIRKNNFQCLKNTSSKSSMVT